MLNVCCCREWNMNRISRKPWHSSTDAFLLVPGRCKIGEIGGVAIDIHVEFK